MTDHNQKTASGQDNRPQSAPPMPPPPAPGFLDPRSTVPPANDPAAARPGFQVPPAAPYGQPAPAPYVPRSKRLLPNGRYPVGVGTFAIPIAFMLLHIALQTFGQIIVTMLHAGPLIANASGDEAIEIVSELLFSRNTEWMMIGSILAILCYSLALYVMRRRGRPYVMLRRPPMSESVAGFVAIASCMGMATLYMILLQVLAQFSSGIEAQLKQYEALSEMLVGAPALWQQILVISFLVPVAEELLFRGIICGELRRVAPDWVVILGSALIFAIFHMNLIQGGYVIIAGLVLGAVYVWTESLALVIALHALYNFMGSSLGLILGDNETAQIAFFVVQLVLIPLGIIALIWLYRRHRRRHSATPAAALSA